jgi:3'-phosphoadenosine 5'-phosphosulfate sulfotransferase (PAPS reductase)/FAD synthetase
LGRRWDQSPERIKRAINSYREHSQDLPAQMMC